jgi:protein tyrosine phosphatase
MPIIHCKAGIGRSGTLAAVVSAYKRISQQNENSLMLVLSTAQQLRNERVQAISTLGQYKSVYKALKILVEEDGRLYRS